MREELGDPKRRSDREEGRGQVKTGGGDTKTVGVSMEITTGNRKQ